MSNFQLHFISIYLNIIINAECLQYLHELTVARQKKTKTKKKQLKNKTW